MDEDTSMDRRRFLGVVGTTGAAVLAGALTGCTDSTSGPPTAGTGTSPPASLPVRPAEFPDGVMAGDPWPDGAVVWTRVSPASGASSLAWQVAPDATFSSIVASGTASVDATRDHTARVVVEGLDPDRWYHYRFMTAEGSSPTGRLRTAPATGADVESLTFAWASCQQINDSLYVAHRAAANEPDLDFFMHLGDYVYVHDQKTLTVDDYRGVYHRFKANAMLQELQGALPLVAMFDDGEFYNGVDRLGERERLVAARRAWDETMPVNLRADGSEPAYRRLQWGNLVDLFMLDVRSYRDAAIEAGDTSTPEGAHILDEGRTTLGPDQKAWLLSGLRESSAAWRFLGNPYNMAMVRIIDGDPGPPRPPGVRPNEGNYFPNEAWDDYNAERREVLQAIVDGGVNDVVSVSGHTHVWIAGRMRPDPDDDASPVAAFDFTCGSLTADPDLLATEGSTPEEQRRRNRAIEDAGLKINPDLRYINLIDQGYGVATVTKDEVLIEFKLIDPFDERAQPTVGARFRLPRGATDITAERFSDAER